MKIGESLSILESAEFDATAGLASGYGTFCRIVSSHGAFCALTDILSKDSESKKILLARIASLAQKKVDSRYLNLFDTAFAAYLYALSLVDLDLAQSAAMVVSNIENCHWAKLISKHLLSFAKVKEIRNRASLIEHQLISDRSKSVPVTFSSAAHLSFEISGINGSTPVQVGVVKQGRAQEYRWTIANESHPQMRSSPYATVRYMANAL